jgi:uncharacterized membrane protein
MARVWGRSPQILIVEKKNDGTPFELHTSHADQSNYYKPIRNAWVTTLLLLLGLSFWAYLKRPLVFSELVLFITLGLLCLIPVVRYQKRITTLSMQANIEE